MSSGHYNDINERHDMNGVHYIERFKVRTIEIGFNNLNLL